jgi:hypothetical protein
MGLFDIDDPNAAQGYRNIRAGASEIEAEIKAGLEALWVRYEPYAYTNFLKAFSEAPEDRFWEMYLAVVLLKARKTLRPRAKLTKASRNKGPDICIPKRKRKIWIEAIAPDPGDDVKNLDRVPNLFPASADGSREAPRREIELRITSSLFKKMEHFQLLKEEGVVAETDSCVIAITAGKFALQAADFGLPHAVTAVYPFGDEHNIVDPKTLAIVDREYDFSPDIKRTGKDPIPRSAFQNELFASISGLIWSRRSIGNFLGQPDDFVYVHNQAAVRPIQREWMNWVEEFQPVEGGKQLRRLKRRACPPA